MRVFVACEDGEKRVLGFYSLVTSTLEAKTFPGFGKRLIPAVYLAMIGVRQNWREQNKGTGTALMVDAFNRTLAIAEHAGVYCLWLDAMDEDVARFYEGIQFQRVREGELRMYIPIQTIRDAVAVPA